MLIAHVLSFLTKLSCIFFVSIILSKSVNGFIKRLFATVLFCKCTGYLIHPCTPLSRDIVKKNNNSEQITLTLHFTRIDIFVWRRDISIFVFFWKIWKKSQFVTGRKRNTRGYFLACNGCTCKVIFSVLKLKKNCNCKYLLSEVRNEFLKRWVYCTTLFFFNRFPINYFWSVANEPVISFNREEILFMYQVDPSKKILIHCCALLTNIALRKFK